MKGGGGRGEGGGRNPLIGLNPIFLEMALNFLSTYDKMSFDITYTV